MKEITVHETRVETYDGEIHKDREAAKDHLREEYLALSARVHKVCPDGGHDVMDKLLDNLDLIMRWATVSKDYHEFESAFPEEDES